MTTAGQTTKPDAALAALRRLAAAEDAVRHHRGPPAGEAYDRKVAEWRSAYNGALRLGRTTPITPKEDAADAVDAG